MFDRTVEHHRLAMLTHKINESENYYLKPYILPDCKRVLKQLSKYYEILAVDLLNQEVSDEVSPEQKLDEQLGSMQMYFSRYSMRAVFDCESNITEYAINALKELSVSFYHTIKTIK